MDKDSIYDFVVKDSEMQDVPISTFKEKVLLVVNVASECGFTYQYKGLQDLYEKHKKQAVEEDKAAKDNKYKDKSKGQWALARDATGKRAPPLCAAVRTERGPAGQPPARWTRLCERCAKRFTKIM